LDIHLDNPVKRTTAKVTFPLPNPDKPYKFRSQYPVKLHIEADIFNLFDTNMIAVEVSTWFLLLFLLNEINSSFYQTSHRICFGQHLEISSKLRLTVTS
jgi:hypothetical protein